MPVSDETALRRLIEIIAAGDADEALRLLEAAPALATVRLMEGATRQQASENFLPTLGRGLYAGDTALHVAAAAWRADLVRRLIALGADTNVANRLGARPLHAAANGDPDAARWDPRAQAATIAELIARGADPNAVDNNGSTPLHKAIRTRCAAAAEALIIGGADPTVPTRNGSTPMRLASVSSGRGGVGSAAAKAQQAAILDLLRGG